MKKCNKCGNELPDTLDYFPPNKTSKNGRNARCRKCVVAQQNDWKRKHSIKLAERRRELYRQHYGHIARENERKRRERKPFQTRASTMRSGMLGRSKKLKLPFDKDHFTVKFITDWLINTPECPCCGNALDCGYKKVGGVCDASPSIDRIHPEKGYVIGNVAIICWRCNNLKRDADPNELRKVVEWMESVWGV